MVSVTPETIDASEEAEIVIECTDTSESVNSNMTVHDVTLLADGEVITLDESSLSESVDVDNGVRHTFKAKGFSRGGNLSVKLKGGVVSDDSGNTNEEKTFETNATIHKTLTITFEKGPGVSEIGKIKDTCELEAGASSCMIELPTITELPGYEKGLWYENIDDLDNLSDGKTPGSTVTISEDTTYHAVAKDETLPICKVISAVPTRIDASESTTIVIECSDTSGSVLSSLTKDDITPLVGGKIDTPETKTLSPGEYTDNIVRHTLQIGGFTRGGTLALTIASKVSDGSGNKNVETTLTTDVVIEKRLNVDYETISGVSSIGKNKDYCILEDGQSSCEIELPSITPLTGYSDALWYEDETGIGEGKSPSTRVQISTDKTFYAKATDKEVPICSVIAADPKAINKDGQTVIEFECTDTTGIVSSSLNVDDITVKVGATEDNPTTKILDEGSQTSKGVKHTLTLGGFSKHGELSFIIPAGKFTDASNNGNQITPLTPGVNIGDNITVRFEAGTGVSEVGKPSDYCEVAGGEVECSVELPSITELPGYTDGLWYETASPDRETVGLAPGKQVTVSEDKTYYAIAKDKENPTCKIISSEPNLINKDSSTEIVIECSDTSGTVISNLTADDIDIYVDEETDYPNIKELTPSTPSEAGIRHTLTVGGFSRKGSLSIVIKQGKVRDLSNNTNDKLTLDADVDITNEKTAQFKKGAGVKDISYGTDSCEILNGKDSCEVTLPSITTYPGYSDALWYDNENGTGDGLQPGNKVSIKDNVTYYAVAKDKERPECKLVSGTPRYVNRDNSATIIFECSDTSGTVTSNLGVNDIDITIGGVSDVPTIKELSSSILESGGISYTLTVGKFNRSGDLAFTIAGGKISDSSGNTNLSKTISPEITVNERVTVTLKSGGGVENIDDKIYCDIENGNSSCEVTLPEITPLPGYSNALWYEDISMSSAGISPKNRVTVSSDKTYYAIAKDTDAPTCSIVSEDPLNINREGSTTIAIECSDTSGSVTSFLNTSDFTILVGGQADEPNIKRSSKTESDGKIKHTLTLGEFNRSGQIAISIPGNKVRDESLNYNIATTLTSRVFINDRITVKFEQGSGVESIGSREDYCDATSAGGCSIDFPTIKSLPGYDDGLWYDNEEGTGDGIAAGSSKTVTESKTYHAIAKDTTNPECILISATPKEIGQEETATVVIECTDTSGSVVSKLTESNMSVSIGSTVDNSVTKSLSSTPLSNGVRYNIKLSNFSQLGSLALTLPTGAVEDGSGNKSDGKTISLGVEVKKRIMVFFEARAGVVSVGEEKKYCDLTGTTQNCTVDLPTITSQAGYDDGLWYDNESGSGTGKKPGSSVTVSSTTTYYAVAKDTTKPVCKFVSATPTEISKTQTTNVTIDCTDTSGSVISTLKDSEISVSVGGKTDAGVSKTLSSNSITDGIRYSIALSNFSTGGEVAITIPAGAVHDASNNQNSRFSTSTNVTVKNSKTLTIVRKTGISKIGGKTDTRVIYDCSINGSDLSCSIDLPELTYASGYEGGAYARDESASDIINSNNITMVEDTTIYAFGYKDLVLNLKTTTGVVSLASTKASCRAHGSNSCKAMLPLVSAYASGYSRAKYVSTISATSGGYDPGDFITISQSMNGGTYYAIGVSTYTITLYSTSSVEYFGEHETGPKEIECTRYGSARCSVELPDIQLKSGYSNPVWELSGGSAAVSYAPGSTIYPEGDESYYAKGSRNYTLTITIGTGIRYIDGYARTYTDTCSVESSGQCSITVPSLTVSSSSYSGGGLVSSSNQSKILYEQYDDIIMTGDASYIAVGYKDVTVTYRYGTGVRSIGKSSDTCKLVGTESSCSLNLPSITTNTGLYLSYGYWYEGSSSTGHYTAGLSPGSSINVSSSKTYIALGVRLVQLNIYRTGPITQINGSTNNPYSLSGYAYGNENALFTLPTTTPASLNGEKVFFSEDEDGVQYVGEQGGTYYLAPSSSTSTPTKTYTLYAVVEETITVTFKAYSGAGTAYLSGNTSTTSKQVTCNKIGNQGSCQVQTPTITVASGYNSGSGLWYEGNNLTTAPSSAVGVAGGSYIYVSSNTTYTAIATRTYTYNFYSTTSANVSGASSQGYVSKQCNASGSTGECSISIPSIVAASGYSSTYYSTQSTGSLSSSMGVQNIPAVNLNSSGTISIKSNNTYYAIASKALKRTFTNSDGYAGGISSISPSGEVTCTIYGNTTSCSIKSPSISVRSGWNDPRWYENSADTNIVNGYPFSSTMVLNTSTSGSNATGKTYYARAYRTFQANFYNNSAYGVVAFSKSDPTSCNVFGSTSSCSIKLPTITTYAAYYDGAIWGTSSNYSDTTGDIPGATKVLTATISNFYAVGYQIYHANFQIGEGVTGISQNQTTCYAWGNSHSCNAATPKITGYAQNYVVGSGFFTGSEGATSGVPPESNITLSGNGVTKEFTVWAKATKEAIQNFAQMLMQKSSASTNEGWTSKSETERQQPLITIQSSNLVGNDHPIYRYMGNMPENYVYWHGEQWRIISVESQYSDTSGWNNYVKMIKATSIGSMPWYGSSRGTDWSSSSTKSYLNGTYLVGLTSDVDYLVSMRWYFGGDYYAEFSYTTAYEKERENSSETTYGRAGLISLSDYLGSHMQGYNQTCVNNSNACNTSPHSWIYEIKGSTSQMWTLTANTVGSSAFVIGQDGTVPNHWTDTSYPIFPVVYLRADVLYNGGVGGSGNHYTIKLP